MKGFKNFLGLIFSVIFLFGCGGSDGDSGNVSAPSDSSDDKQPEVIYQLSDYEFPAYQVPNSITGLTNADFGVAFFTGSDELKSEAVLNKVVSLIDTGVLEVPITTGIYRNDINMDRVTLYDENEYGYQYLMPEYEGTNFSFEYEGETIDAKVEFVYILTSKYPALDTFAGYHDMPNGDVDVIIDVTFGDDIVGITNMPNRQDYDTGQMTRSYSDYDTFNETMISQAFWSRISEEFQQLLLAEGSIAHSFHDQHCTYVGDGLLGLTRLNTREFYVADFPVEKENESDEETKPLSLLTETVAYYDDMLLVGANGTEFELTEIRVRAKANVSPDVYFETGIEELEFKRTQELIDVHGLYSYYLNFKYNDMYADIQCKRIVN